MTTRVMLVSPAAGDAQREVRFDDDGPLSTAGLRRVRAAAGSLPPADRTLASPSVRCRDTAAELGLSARPAPELAGCAMGDWRGRILSEVADADPVGVSSWLRDPDFDKHGGESLRQLCDRIMRLADAVGAGHGPGGGRRRTGCRTGRGGVRAAGAGGRVLATGCAAADRDRAERPGRTLESRPGAGAGSGVSGGVDEILHNSPVPSSTHKGDISAE